MNKLTIKQLVEELEKNNKRYVYDGIYDASNVAEVLLIDNIFDAEASTENETSKQIINLCTKYPEWCIASPYNTDCTLLLSHRPIKFKGEELGSGFNYGSCNFLENCPSKILILAEND